MKERPILFNGEMVRAILDGRKTQTRRAVKPQPHDMSAGDYYFGDWVSNAAYGQPGDRLWVRETYRESPHSGLIYQADHRYEGYPWTPSIHMSRWASRITLQITGVRVERLQEISEEDAKAEGCISTAKLTADGSDYSGLYAYDAFCDLWDSLAKPGMALADNPWVWVIEFKRINPERRPHGDQKENREEIDS